MPPIRRFELARPASLEVIDGDFAVEEEPRVRPKTVSRRVDQAGRISILKHRYHVGRHLSGEAVTIESSDGLLHVSHNGVVVATHARRHLIDDDDRMDRRAKVSRAAQPTKGGEVLRIVDKHGSISFAGIGYRVATGSSGPPSASASSPTRSRSPLTGRCSGPIVLVMTAPRSSAPSLSHEASPGRTAMVWHRYRSQSGTRVVNLHKTPGPGQVRTLLWSSSRMS